MSKSLQISFDGVYYNQADLSASGNDPTTLELSPPVVCTSVRIEVLSTHSSNNNGLSSVQLYRTVSAPNGLCAKIIKLRIKFGDIYCADGWIVPLEMMAFSCSTSSFWNADYSCNKALNSDTGSSWATQVFALPHWLEVRFPLATYFALNLSIISGRSWSKPPRREGGG